MSGLASVAASGPILAALAVAALAGLVSFLAPCMLPLVPGYLSYVTGLAGTGLQPTTAGLHASATAVGSPRERDRTRRAVAGSALFVLGFTVVFTMLAFAAGSFGRVVLVHQRGIEVVAGLGIIAMGLVFLDVLPWLGPTWRMRRLPRAGLAGAPALGAVFALSWTPCLSPTLAVVLTLAAVQGSAGRGALLAAAYSLGVGLPFVVFAFGYSRTLGAVAFIRRHSRWVSRAGGIALIAVGLALTLGIWGEFLNWLRATVGPGQIGI